MEIDFHGFGEQAERRGGLFKAIDEVFADNRVKGGVIRGEMDITCHFTSFFEVIGIDGFLSIWQTKDPAIVDTLDV